MIKTKNALSLRSNQTAEERQLWQALKGRRFAGFKFRREHPVGQFFLDFYCPMAKLSVELDGFHHGTPEQLRHDEARKQFLDSKGVEELRFWNHQWVKNRPGVLLDIWNALHRRTGCVAVEKKSENHTYLPPKKEQILQAPSNSGGRENRRTAVIAETNDAFFVAQTEKAPPLPIPLLHFVEERVHRTSALRRTTC